MKLMVRRTGDFAGTEELPVKNVYEGVDYKGKQYLEAELTDGRHIRLDKSGFGRQRDAYTRTTFQLVQ